MVHPGLFTKSNKNMAKKRQVVVLLAIICIVNLLLYIFNLTTNMAKGRISNEPSEGSVQGAMTKQASQKLADRPTTQPYACYVQWSAPQYVERDRWQPAGVDNDTYVFSAYLDLRTSEKIYVRIVGITSTYKTSFWNQPNDHCRLWYGPVAQGNSMTSISVPAERLLVPETHERK